MVVLVTGTAIRVQLELQSVPMGNSPEFRCLPAFAPDSLESARIELPAFVLGGHRRPVLGQPNHSARIHQTVAERMGNIPADTISYPVPGSEVDGLGSADDNVL